MRRLLPIIAPLAVATLVSCKPPEVSISETPVTVASDRAGYGRVARTGDLVSIDYCIKLPNGDEVLRAVKYQFELGQGAVIEGVDDAVTGMRAGGHRTVECPPQKHWGRNRYGPIPENTTLTLEIQLVSIE